MAHRLRIAIIDDHPLFREGVVSTLRGSTILEVVGQGGSAEDAIRIAKENLPDIVLLDVSMPGGGIVAARSIARLCPIVKIIMLTVSENEQDIAQAFDAGARGYVLKGTSGADLIETTLAISRGAFYLSPGLLSPLICSKREPTFMTLLAELTEREAQILSHVARGYTNKEIARTLRLSDKTIKHYMTNVMQKLGVRNRVEATLYFRAGGAL